jgi:hypothetical protein
METGKSNLLYKVLEVNPCRSLHKDNKTALTACDAGTWACMEVKTGTTASNLSLFERSVFAREVGGEMEWRSEVNGKVMAKGTILLYPVRLSAVSFRWICTCDGRQGRRIGSALVCVRR